MRTIGEKLSFVHEVDDMEARVLITFDSRKPLKFAQKVGFHTGEVATIQFKYERLFKHFSHCGFLTHEFSTCPMRVPEAQPRLPDARPDIFSRLHSGPSFQNSGDTGQAVSK